MRLLLNSFAIAALLLSMLSVLDDNIATAIGMLGGAIALAIMSRRFPPPGNENVGLD
jgi:hypothetical protein